MMSLFFERVAFLAALSALVIALLWVHVRKFLTQINNKLIKTYNVILYGQEKFQENYDKNQFVADDNDDATYHQKHKKLSKVIKDHPKFSSRSSRGRKTSEKESIISTYRSLEGYGQSALERDVSFSKGFPLIPDTNHYEPSLSLIQQHSGHALAGIGGGGGGGGGGGRRVESGINDRHSSSATLLTLFSASVIALIIYTTMKLLTTRFGGGSGLKKRAYYESRAISSRKETSKFRNCETTKDLRGDKRKFTRLSREERVRQLILHHGGRNVSSAIRFLVDELEKQKQLLFENLLLESNNDYSCPIACCNNYTCGCNNLKEKECCDNKNKTTTNMTAQDCCSNNKHNQSSLLSKTPTSDEHKPSKTNNAKKANPPN